MQKKLFITYALVIILMVIAVGGSFWFRGYQYINQQNEKQYLNQVKMLADIFESMELSEEEEFNDFAVEYAEQYGFRITVIKQDGTVVGDSSSQERTMENHESREEVQQALQTGEGFSTRHSDTMNIDYLYCAVSVNTNDFSGVLRISVPLEQLKIVDKRFMETLLLSFLFVMAIALALSMYFIRYITRPIDDITIAAEKISKGEYDSKIYTSQKDQIGSLAVSFNHMTDALKDSMDTLTNQNMELEAILSSMESGIIAVDNASEIMFYNKAFLKIMELVDHNIQGKSFFQVVRNSLLFEIVDQVRAEKESVRLEGKIVLSDEKFIRVIGTPLRQAEDKQLGALIIMEDITELKKLEHMRSDFVSNVTHELKTPLTSIKGFVDTLKSGAIKDEPVARKFLDIIDIETERLYNLIRDILLLSEIESRVEYDVEACQVDHIITEVIELLEPNVNDKTKLCFEAQPYVRPYPCNKDRMKQLVINLVDNAIKCTEEGAVTVRCYSDKENLNIVVEDTGIGMEKQNLARIFERFYRVDKGRSRKLGGTGLGLSIAKHIVEMYHGNILVDSQMEEGTKFHIMLPYS